MERDQSPSDIDTELEYFNRGNQALTPLATLIWAAMATNRPSTPTPENDPHTLYSEVDAPDVPPPIHIDEPMTFTLPPAQDLGFVESDDDEDDFVPPNWDPAIEEMEFHAPIHASRDTTTAFVPEEQNQMRRVGLIAFKKINYPALYYSTEENRLKTFDGRWPSNAKVTPEALAKAGFYAYGEGDKTICHYCGLGLCNWEEDYEPFVEHALFNPHCNFLILIKGREFIYDVYKTIVTFPERTSVNLPEHMKGVIKKHEPQETQDKEKCDTDKGKCVICTENDANVVALPCAHLVTCGNCIITLQKCAMCRANIFYTLRVYL
ncbi:hypothetical protein FOCC_FOCC016894 [Frankliniella occidentalis]|nr:hypothetical protein FOCC_FOCC016894 [Frankliniella occidentalis]